jgi:hypothetical protein
MYLIFLIIVIIVIIISFFYICISKRKKSYNKKAYVTMTTTPERIKDIWFYKNLKRTISLKGDFKIILNVPYISLKGEKYIIPDRVYKLKGDKFTINRCKDEGPITKLLPVLRNPFIHDNSHIIVVDDDIVYKKNIFHLINTGINKHPSKIVTMCNSNIEGFKGFGFVKKTLKGLLSIKIPKICIRIDDDVISTFVKHNKISIVALPYDGNTDAFCSLKKNKTDTHPNWDELNFDNRKPMKKICIKELNKIL